MREASEQCSLGSMDVDVNCTKYKKIPSSTESAFYIFCGEKNMLRTKQKVLYKIESR